MSGSRCCSSCGTTVPSRDGLGERIPRRRPANCPHSAVAMSDAADALAPYDVVLLGSFGGPEAPEDVVPFLRRVTAGRGIPDARLEAVGEHYYARRRPEPDQRPEPRAAGAPARRAGPARDRHPAALGQPQLRRRSSPTPCARRTTLGAARVVTLVTSAYSSYSSCRQYREDLAAAVDAVGPSGRRAGRRQGAALLRPPRVRAAGCRRSSRRCARCPTRHPRTCCSSRTRCPTRWTTPPGPATARATSTRRSTCELARRLTDEVNRELGPRARPASWSSARAPGRRSQPWLEPDVNDRLEELAAEGGRHVVVAPIGFVSDHMEVVHDLDTEAAETAERVGVPFVRVPTRGYRRGVRRGPGRPAARARRRGPRRGASPETWLAGDVRPVGLRARLLPQPAGGQRRRCAAATDGGGTRAARPASTSPSSRRSRAEVAQAAGRLVVDERPATCGSCRQVERHRRRSPSWTSAARS